MDWIKGSIRNKLFLISGAGTVLVLGIAFLGFWFSWQNFFAYRAGANDALTILSMQADFDRQIGEWSDALLDENSALQTHRTNFENLERQVQEKGRLLEDRSGNPEAKNLIGKFLESHLAMGDTFRKNLPSYGNPGFDPRTGHAGARSAEALPDRLLSDAQKALTVQNSGMPGGLKGLEIGSVFIGIAVLAAFLVFSWFIRKGIVQPAKALAESLAHLAKGDFSSPIRQNTRDELGRVAASAEQVRRDLGKIISEVNSSASELTSSAGGLSDTARRVAEASRQQSEAAALSATTVENMTSSIASVSESAEEVQRLAATNLEHTRKGNESLSELVGEMTSVESSVEEIRFSVNEFVSSTDLITTMTREVKDIAEQTNLLALNAAIEAARAGEQGRGFAVVADEVRKLAEKSAHAASEIDTVTQKLGMQSSVVDDSIEKGMASLRLSQDFLESVAMILAEANDSVSHVDAGMETIARSVREQKAASGDISKNMERIARMAEENDEAVRQALDESLRLDGMAGHLHDTVKRFRV